LKLPIGFETIHLKPYPYQIETINYGILHRNAGILLSMGLGKTMCAINIARYRIQNDNCKKVLVICPLTIMDKWKKEIQLISEYKATIIRGTPQQKKELIKQDTHFHIINYDALARLFVPLEDKKFDILIADESARFIQNPTPKRTEAALYLSKIAKHRMLLTGILISKRPLNLWSQFSFLDKGKTFGDNFYRFRNTYFYQISLGESKFKKYVVNKRRIADINKKIFSTCILFDRKEISDQLPEVLPTCKSVIVMDEDLQNTYDNIKQNILSEIATEGGEVKLGRIKILGRLIRLQQITSGFIKDSTGEYVRLSQTPKLDALVEEIESIYDDDESMVIWCCFLFSIDMIKKELAKREIAYISMTGADSAKEKNKKWMNYQKTNKIKVFIGQIVAGGIGIELFKLDATENEIQHMLFYDRTWVFDHTEQAAGRINRLGQKAKVRYNHFVVENSIDEKMYDTQTSDKDIADEIMSHGVKKFLT